MLYENSLSQEIQLEQLASYVSEDSNPNNRRRFQFVDIEIPDLKRFAGLRFVDTPGLGSVFKHNTAASLGWLPKVAIAVVVIGVDPPLSEQDRELIKEVIRFTPKIVIAVTKVDLMNSDQISEILKFIRYQLLDQLQGEWPVYPISLLPKENELFQSFIRSILLPLTQHRNSATQEILEFKLNTLLNECKGFLRVAVEAPVRTVQEREQLRERVLGEKLNFSSTREELQLLIRDLMGKTRSSYIGRLEVLAPSILNRLTKHAQEQFQLWSLNLWKLTATFEDWLCQEMLTEMAGISIQERAFFAEPLRKADTSLRRAVESFYNRLARNV